jgi:hypothetical protein
MKKIFSLLCILVGLTFTHSAFAQNNGDTTKTTKGKKESAKKADTKANPGGNNGSGTITIDEGGTPRTQGKKTPSSMNNGGNGTPADSTNSAPKQNNKPQQSAEKSSPAPAPGAPDMAIDEGGTPKEKPKTSGNLSQPNTGLSNDSALVAPASGLERPH